MSLIFVVFAMMGGLGMGIRVEVQTPAWTRLRVAIEPHQRVHALVAIPEGSTPQVQLASPVQGVEVRTQPIAKIRDFAVLPVEVRAEALSRPTEIVLDIAHPGGTYPQTYTPSFEGLYRQVLVNFDHIPARPEPPRVSEVPQGARYLIIAPDDFVDALQPLVAWKTEKGMLAQIAPLSVTGVSAAQIKAYIQNAYETWEIPPEYVLLAGGAQVIPYTNTDNFYVTVDGADPLIDIFIGRFPATTVSQIDVMVAKTVGYETVDPIWPDTAWFRKATIIVRNDYDADDSIYYADAQVAQQYLYGEGYTQVDLFDRVHNNNAADVILSVNDGRSIVFYRGQGVGNWWPPFEVNPYVLSNGWKLPIVISTTCATIDPYSGNAAGEQWLRAGTADTPKGAVGFFGTTTIRSHVAHLRSAVAQGFFFAAFDTPYVSTLMEACEAGRLNLLYTYGDLTDYNGFLLLGDPELTLRTKVPRPLTVVFPDVVPTGSTEIPVSVYDEGTPVPGALVALYRDTLFYAYGYTDSTGTVVFSGALDFVGTLYLTVTKRNYLPDRDSLQVIPEGPYPGQVSLILHDDQGNGDGLPNPGETPTLDLVVVNLGSQDAHELEVFLRSNSPHVVVQDSSAWIGTFVAGDSVTIPEAFRIWISPHSVAEEQLSFSLWFEAEEGNWSIPVSPLVVHAPRVEVVGLWVQDPPPGGNGNGEPEAGEAVYLYPIVSNTGNAPIGLTTLRLLSGVHYAPSDPQSYFLALAEGQMDTLTDPFAVGIDPAAVSGTVLSLRFTAEGEAETYVYRDTLSAELVVLGVPQTSYPTGPDDYGYYIYDDTDLSSGNAPTFTWVEIAPPDGPGTLIQEITNQDADTVTLSLPFPFAFYGQTFTQVGVASNGFLEMGGSTYRFGDNGSIPQPGGPHALIAPFWDDLDPSVGGDVYQWYDSVGHRWIVEFKNVEHYGGGDPETFEVIFLDPAYWPTPTGDGEILILYQQVSDITSATVGIEDPTESIGLQYVFNNTYDPTAAPIQDGRALRITTLPPQNPPPTLWVHTVDTFALVDSLGGNGDGAPEPGETLSVWIPLTNDGESPATGVVLHVSVDHPMVTLLDSVVPYGDLVPGDTVWPVSPWRVALDPALPDTGVEFTLAIELSDSGGTFVEYWGLLFTAYQAEEHPSRPPLVWRLGPVYPNPSPGPLTLRLEIPVPSQVVWRLIDLTGRQLREYRRVFTPGVYVVPVLGPQDRLPAGLYFLKVDAGSHRLTSKVLILR